MFFHDILNVWHRFATCFVTNSRSYGHSSNLEWQKTFYWKICFSMTFSTSDITSSLFSSQTLVVMAIVPIWNHQKIFLVKNRFFHHILNKWHHFVISFVTNSRGYGHSSNLESSKNLFSENRFFHHILDKWHHFVISFVTNSRGYGHSYNLEITKQFFIEKYVFPWHFEEVTSLPHLFRLKLAYLWP